MFLKFHSKMERARSADGTRVQNASKRSKHDQKRWNDGRETYVCGDTAVISVRHQTVKTGPCRLWDVPRSCVFHRAFPRNGVHRHTVLASGTQYDREMSEVLDGDHGARTALFPATVREVAVHAFGGARALRSVILNAGLEKIGPTAFMDTGLTRVSVPESVAQIGDMAFQQCRALKSVVFQDRGKLRYIGQYCFYRTGLEQVRVPGGVEQIKKDVFAECEALRHISLGEGVRALDKEALTGTRPESMELPSTLEQIRYSFDSFKALRWVRLPVGRMEISSRVSEQFARLVVFSDAKEICYSPAFRCFGLEEINFEEGCRLERIGPNAFQNTRIKSFSAPESLREIGWMAFGNCRELRGATLNRGLERLGDLCFWGTSIVDVKIPRTVQKTFKQLGMSLKSVRKLVLPAGLETVGQEWFADSDVEKVVLSKTVRTLENSAFMGCKKLREISFPKGSRLEVIGDHCFQKSGLEHIKMPSGLKVIEEMAFARCERLRRVYLNEGLKALRWLAFWGSAIEAVQIPASLCLIQRETFDDCKNLRRVRLLEGLRTIEERSFRDTGIEEIAIPASVREIGAQAFQGCRHLKKVIFAEGSDLR